MAVVRTKLISLRIICLFGANKKFFGQVYFGNLLVPGQV